MELGKLTKSIISWSMAWGNQMDQIRARMYAIALLDSDCKDIPSLLKESLKTHSRLPSAAELIKLSKGNIDEKDNAVLLSGKIIDAIAQFGYMNKQEAHNYLGDQAWRAVELFGGWERLCRADLSQMQSIRAQLRDLCMATTKSREFVGITHNDLNQIM